MNSSQGFHSRQKNSIKRPNYMGERMSKAQKEEFLKKAWALYRKGIAIKNIAETLDKPYQFTCKILKAAITSYQKERLVDTERFLTEQMARLESIALNLQEAWDTAVKMNKKPDDKYMVGIMKALEDQRKIMGLDKASLSFPKEGEENGKAVIKMNEDERIAAITDIISLALEKNKVAEC